MTAADIATVTPELEAACRKLIEGMQLGGPYLPVVVQPAARAVPRQSRRRQLGRHVVQSAAGLPVRQHQRAGADLGPARIAIRARPGRRRPTASGNRVDPDGPYRGRAGRRTLQHRTARLATAAVPAAAVGTADRGQRQHRRVRVARAARRHRQPAAGQAEDRPARQRRHDRDRRRARLRRRHRRQPLPRVRREDRQGAVDLQARAAPRRRRR